jgi:plastocyanin
MGKVAILLAIGAIGLVFAASASTMSAPSASMKAATKLTGKVGPGFTITLRKGSKKVTKLKPGRYTFVINDVSNAHNFHLRGPGVNKTTSVAAKGKRTWKVTLRKGTYRFVCDPHASQMRGRFRVS